MSIRVCYVTMAFPTPYETFAGSDVRALRRAGVNVSVFSLRPRHPDAIALVDRWRLDTVGISHNSVGATFDGVMYALRHPGRFLALIAWLVRSMWRMPRFLLRALVLAPRCLDILATIEQRRPDVVHLFWGHYPAAVGFLVRRYCPRTVLSMFLGAYDLEWGFRTSAEIARSADVVWTHARTNVAAIEALGVAPSRISVAHRGIEVERFTKQPPAKITRRIVTVGRITRSKGMGEVIEAFATIVRTHPDATLVVVGDGPDLGRLETLAKQLGVDHAVSFTGRVSHDTVLEQMGAAELFIYMSTEHTDRLPNVVKEAVASRCVCVVSRTAGIEELIRDGVDGWVVERGDITAATERACDVLDDPDRALPIVASATQHLREEFDVDRSMRRYIDRWSDLLGLAKECSVPSVAVDRVAMPVRRPNVHESAARH